ncbi:DUF2306 domain-containing protein [Agromyces sp. LHK192]|uniref:DUF2306 domain-containing protein n=1 Tax=Agromyces sp. LHK192 TaxID=2498704 RepID=UPI000FD8CF57|nr:DUF2306 domain-containing protein [Agromyces sp. LHK192]
MTESSRRSPAEWMVPAGLLVLSVIPILGGAMRVSELSTGAVITEENARFFHSPVPVLVHIVGSTVYLVLGALQFAPALRRRRWHRISGRIVLPMGLASALSALWMTVFYVIPPPAGPALAVMRLVVGVAMTAALITAFLAIRRGDVGTHRAWMIRAYAIGMGAGTQVLTVAPYAIITGRAPDTGMHAVLMGAGWAINLVIAEIAIRRGASRPRPAAANPPVGASAVRPIR